MKVQRMLVGGLMVAAFVTCFALGMANAQVQGQYPDLGAWANDTWFRVKLTVTTYHFDGVGIKPKPSGPATIPMGTAYINITTWNNSSHVLTANIWARDDKTGIWGLFFEGLEITYFAGSDLKFIGSAQLVTLDDVTMGLIFVFTGKKNPAGNFILGGVTKLSTIGGSILEVDNADDAPVDLKLRERWAGSATISGPMVSSIPFTPVR